MKKFNMLFTAWGILVVLIMSGLIVLGFVFKKNLKEYKSFENKLMTAANIYVEDNEIMVKKNEKKKISISKLYKAGLIDKKDLVKSCSGGVIVKKTEIIPNIKCKYYKSIK